MRSFYDFSQDDEQEWLIEEITSHQWSDSKELKLEVRWTLGDTTWEPLVRGCPISHFCCSKFHPTPRSELCSAPISKLHSTLKYELHSTFTPRVTADVK